MRCEVCGSRMMNCIDAGEELVDYLVCSEEKCEMSQKVVYVPLEDQELEINDGPDRTDPGYWLDNF